MFILTVIVPRSVGHMTSFSFEKELREPQLCIIGKSRLGFANAWDYLRAIKVRV